MTSDQSYLSELPNDPRLTQRDACGVGFVAQLEGKKSHQMIKDGLKILHRLDHRGGVASDGRTGDGAGIMLQIPDAFFRKYWKSQNIELPRIGEYAVAMTFLPSQSDLLESMVIQCNQIIADSGLRLIGWRDVPVDSSVLGVLARSSEPVIKQLFIAQTSSNEQFKWKLYVLRKRLESYARDLLGQSQREFYIPSLSTDTITFKGLLRSDDIDRYYLDLQSEEMTSAFAMVHQRFSTNTLPAWPLAQPFRHICHNGEINTLRGNLNWMHARSKLLKSDLYEQKDINDILPICPPSLSDSASLDNAVEFLLHTGRSIPKVLTMLIPQPWEGREDIADDLKAYYEYQSCLMEPWDGPAFVGFADSSHIGAVLDRNGLRPGRYTITKDSRVVMASESGVLDIAEEDILEKGRLSPGRMFMIDLKEGKVVADEKIKQQLSRERPYKAWLTANRQNLPELAGDELYLSEQQKARYYQAFAYSREDINMIIKPMALTGKEPIGSMGNDTPIAAQSKKRPLLYNYFKQLFAQVTNPPIDAIREKMVTSLSVRLGGSENLFEESQNQCRVLLLDNPVLNSAKLKLIESGFHGGLVAQRISIAYENKKLSLEDALEILGARVADFVRDGKNIIVLSDKDTSHGMPAIPALLAVSAVHHHLVKIGLRTKCSLIVESGEIREVHHFCTLIGFGADAIYPYLALATAAAVGDSQESSVNRYIEAVKLGILKVMSKMGISTLQSYHGAQIFEALGLSKDLVDQYFCGTQTRIGGIQLDRLEGDNVLRNRNAFEASDDQALEEKGDYYWRKEGEAHLHNPAMIAGLQKATRLSSREEFYEYCKKIDDQSEQTYTIRGRFVFKDQLSSIPLDEVESVASIMKRFSTGAMSFGSISKEAHETIAIAMNRVGARSNSGEGGEDPSRFTPDSNGDLRRSSIKQVASGRFGVTSHYLVNADEIQIKMAQGAKPGEGGQLPGHKVDLEIAKVRHSTPGVPLISPPPHHDIYSIEDLAQLISDLKHSNRDAKISVKLVSALGVGTIASGVAKAKADSILISGCEGGTGASPLTSIKHAGMPWELGLSEAHRILSENFLRKRVRLIADGQIRTPRDIAIATILGADEWSIGTAALVTLGCIMMRKCHLNTCPVGIATQDPELRKRFRGQPEHLVNYLVLLAEGLREIMASLGVPKVDELVGRVDLLRQDLEKDTQRISGDDLDLSYILQPPRLEAIDERHLEGFVSLREEVEKGLDLRVLYKQAEEAFHSEKEVTISHKIQNIDRSVGTVLSSEISKRFGGKGLTAGRIKLNFTGNAGQSFMAFGARGIRATIEGDVNDYCAKGLSGGEVIVKPSAKATFKASDNVICGNTALYGATSGHLFVNGKAGERFAVRNSGAMAVVEGTGDHGCEYMTGGCVVVIGQVGVNFAAGMSGGISYVLDEDGSFSHTKVNHELVSLASLVRSDEEDELIVQQLLNKHLAYTNSEVAARILADWDYYRTKFIRVLPNSYRDILMQKRQLSRQKANQDKGFESAELATEEGGCHHG